MVGRTSLFLKYSHAREAAKYWSRNVANSGINIKVVKAVVYREVMYGAYYSFTGDDYYDECPVVAGKNIRFLN